MQSASWYLSQTRSSSRNRGRRGCMYTYIGYTCMCISLSSTNHGTKAHTISSPSYVSLWLQVAMQMIFTISVERLDMFPNRFSVWMHCFCSKSSHCVYVPDDNVHNRFEFSICAIEVTLPTEQPLWGPPLRIRGLYVQKCAMSLWLADSWEHFYWKRMRRTTSPYPRKARLLHGLCHECPTWNPVICELIVRYLTLVSDTPSQLRVGLCSRISHQLQALTVKNKGVSWHATNDCGIWAFGHLSMLSCCPVEYAYLFCCAYTMCWCCDGERSSKRSWHCVLLSAQATATQVGDNREKLGLVWYGPLGPEFRAWPSDDVGDLQCRTESYAHIYQLGCSGSFWIWLLQWNHQPEGFRRAVVYDMTHGTFSLQILVCVSLIKHMNALDGRTAAQRCKRKCLHHMPVMHTKNNERVRTHDG